MTDRPQDGAPESEGLGEEAGPDFAPPGAGISHGPPHPAPPGPQPPHPPPSGPPRALGFAEPPPPPASPSRGVIIGLVAAVTAVALIVGAVGVARTVLTPKTDPAAPWTTPPPEKQPPLPTEPELQRGTGFTFTSPAGWTRSPEWGDNNDGKIVDAAGNDITVYIFPAADPKKRCDAELRSLEVWVPGEISELPDRKVDGRPAPGGQLAGEDTYRMRCAVSKGALFNISMQSDPDQVEEVDAAFTAVLDSWKWS